MSAPATARAIDPDYPDSDGRPIADNTLQYEWIATIKGNLDALFADRDDVFVAADLLWYPERRDDDPRRAPRAAPDALVAFGRPKGYRGSYKQWQEGGVAPQVVFEVLSPENTAEEMDKKREWYERYGVEEYYVIDPRDPPDTVEVWLRRGGRLEREEPAHGFESPRTGVRFDLSGPVLRLWHPDGRPFLTSVEQIQETAAERGRADSERQRAEAERRRAEAERRRAEAERRRAEAEQRRADSERQRAEVEQRRAEAREAELAAERQRAEAERQQATAERQRAERLAALLRAAGLDPDAPPPGA